MNTFKKDRYLIHCYIINECDFAIDKNLKLKGFKNSTFEQCLANYVRENFTNFDNTFSIVTDIVNKLVILTVTTYSGFVRYTIDKIERISYID